ncbi:MAG: 2-C-methyl-D-erythritol 4-phosphate cytidylyltransferase [Dysgonamonadaceae bacterium]|jgi:2-C-methyl-D-erythritol 4-phosphate cytidylyltransferase|nr:2-C-methyl-D-erythritol 4-phosphate cytidylyltransferase [Dysgonamonadaceae bacterium]
MKQKYIIIVAGGKGTRMGAEIPKQFLILNDKPVLIHTIESFFNYDKTIKIILVLPEEQQNYWNELCAKFDFKINHQIVSGGETRFHSVKNGLDTITEKDVIIGIHDGVRPLVSKDVIGRCFDKAAEKGVAFPVIPVVETLRKKTEKGSITVNRADYCLVQTPQVFNSEIIKKAYQQEFSDTFTDDVSVVESLSEYSVYEVEGARENIKITTPVDLIIAESIINIKMK